VYADVSSMSQRRAAASLIHLRLLLRQVRHGSRRRAGQSGGRLHRERRWIWRLVKAGVLAAEVAGELVVEDVGADLEQEAGAAGCPAHLLLFDHALASDDLGRAAVSSRCRGNDHYPDTARCAAPHGATQVAVPVIFSGLWFWPRNVGQNPNYGTESSARLVDPVQRLAACAGLKQVAMSIIAYLMYVLRPGAAADG
jgi:hypothetical protein